MNSRLTIILAIVLAFSPLVAEEPVSTPLERAQELLAEGSYEEAAAAAHEQLSALEASGEGESVTAADLLDVLLESRWRTGLVDDETRGYGERALEIKRRVLGPGDAGVGKTLHHLAIVAFFNSEYAQAKSM